MAGRHTTMFLSPLLKQPGQRWQLLNADTGATLASRVEGAFDSDSRKKGLLGRSGLDDTALLIAPCNAVHTFFMHFPIDVAIVDRAGAITRCWSDVPSWRVVGWRGFATVELAAGTLRRTATERLHRLVLVPFSSASCEPGSDTCA